MRIRKVGVVGLGTMGGGIAQVSAQCGYSVVVSDINKDVAQQGVTRISEGLDGRVKKGKMKDEERRDILSRISIAEDLKGFADCDLVIEAVFEDTKVKEEVFRALDAHCKPEAILATNTSSLSVTSLSKTVSGGRRSRFVGIHFFYPAQVNRLIEVIPIEGTEPSIIDDATRFARSLGKIPIRVKDAPGFAVNRYFVPILNEACRMLEEGIPPATIEKTVMDALGISMGPFALIMGIKPSIAYHAEASLGERLGEFYTPCRKLREIFDAGKVDVTGEADKDPVITENIRNRVYGLVFTICARMVEEGVATPRDIDIGALVGLAWKKGPFALMNSIGISKSYELAKGFAERYKGLELPETLKRMAETGKRWEMPMVFVEKSGHIARVIIRRPEALNALNDSVLKDLDDAFTSLEKDKSVRVILFMGEGTSFIAGADIKRMLDANMEEIERFLRFGQRVTMRIQNMPQPVIALVNGYALGGGCEMLLSCDFAIASDTAMIGLPEVKLGIHPGFGGTQRLPRAIPLPRAKEMIYTGAQIPASDAEKIGLVARVVKGAELYDAGEEVAGMICANGPIAVQLAKSAVNRGIEQPLKKALETELQSILETFKTKDKTEGLSAFIEKRKPQFKGE